MDEIESSLSPEFIRIHRSYAVRLSDVVSIHSSSGSRYRVELKNGSSLPAGRTKIAKLRQSLLK